MIVKMTKSPCKTTTGGLECVPHHHKSEKDLHSEVENDPEVSVENVVPLEAKTEIVNVNQM